MTALFHTVGLSRLVGRRDVNEWHIVTCIDFKAKQLDIWLRTRNDFLWRVM